MTSEAMRRLIAARLFAELLGPLLSSCGSSSRTKPIAALTSAQIQISSFRKSMVRPEGEVGGGLVVTGRIGGRC
jgi:hypothetical protein